ncbi:MAG: penicillin-binding protein 2, partial [Tidjanibacter sp.]|nr:penicillin-binding protein 2 [Tidjanibacter sp.]
MEQRKRQITLRLVVVAIFVVIIFRLFHIQIIDDSYKEAADNNALRYEVQHPPRGEIYDRNGEFLAQSVAS